MKETRMIIFYDEECTLCVRFKQAISLIDKNNTVQFRSIYDEKVYQDYPELDPEQCEEEVHMINEREVYRGAEVIAELAKTLPGVQKFSWLINKESAKSAMDMFYGQINEMRQMQRKKCFRCGSKKKRYEEREL